MATCDACGEAYLGNKWCASSWDCPVWTLGEGHRGGIRRKIRDSPIVLLDPEITPVLPKLEEIGFGHLVPWVAANRSTLVQPCCICDRPSRGLRWCAAHYDCPVWKIGEGHRGGARCALRRNPEVLLCPEKTPVLPVLDKVGLSHLAPWVATNRSTLGPWPLPPRSDHFTVTLRMCSGEILQISDLLPRMPLEILVGRAEQALGWPSCTARLCSGEMLLKVQDMHQLLLSLGIEDGAELLCVRQPPWRMRCPEDGWQYKDPRGEVQGPFTLHEMRVGVEGMGYFRKDLLIRCHDSHPFRTVAAVFPAALLLKPFQDDCVVLYDAESA